MVVGFGGQSVLSDLDLTIDSGEAVAVVGPSGTGKSTLLAVVGGALEPDRGQVELGEQGRRDGRIVWILQTGNLLLRRTVLDNAMMGSYGIGYRVEQARASAEVALGRVGLSHLRLQRVRKLSGGERQRLVVARSLVGSPGLVLADEPTAQLDRRNALLVAKALLSGRDPSTTVLLATHDDAVANLCDRTVALAGGSLGDV